MVEHPARPAAKAMPAAPMLVMSVITIILVFVTPAVSKIAALEEPPEEEAAMFVI